MDNEYTVEGQFDWMAYKADVAAKMLPVIYPLVLRQHDSTHYQSATQIAISETINIAIELASRLEDRLKGGGK